MRKIRTLLPASLRLLLLVLSVLVAYWIFCALVYGQKVGEETKALETNFKIYRQDNHILMEPLLCPRFKLVLMEGDGIEPNAITKCSVWKRIASVDEETLSVRHVTILRCGRNVYGLSEVQFQVDNPQN